MASRRSEAPKWLMLTATASLTMAVIGTTQGQPSRSLTTDRPLAIHGPGTPQIQRFGNEPPWPIARNETPPPDEGETWVLGGHVSLFGVTVWVDSLRVGIPNLLFKPWLPSDLFTLAWYLQFGAGIRTGCPIPEARVGSHSRLKLLTDPNDLPSSFPTIDLGVE